MILTLKIKPSFSSEFVITLSDEANVYLLSYSGNIDLEDGLLYPSNNTVKKMYLSVTEFNFLINDLLVNKISLIPEFIMGLDGTTYELSVENGFNEFDFKVWGDSHSTYYFDTFINKVIKYIKKKDT